MPLAHTCATDRPAAPTPARLHAERRLGSLALAWSAAGILAGILAVLTGPAVAFHGDTLVQLLLAIPAAVYAARYLTALARRRS